MHHLYHCVGSGSQSNSHTPLPSPTTFTLELNTGPYGPVYGLPTCFATMSILTTNKRRLWFWTVGNEATKAVLRVCSPLDDPPLANGPPSTLFLLLLCSCVCVCVNEREWERDKARRKLYFPFPSLPVVGLLCEIKKGMQSRDLIVQWAETLSAGSHALLHRRSTMPVEGRGKRALGRQ